MQEGNKYSKRLSLGTVENIPVYSFTYPEKQMDEHAPIARYLNIIPTCLLETSPNMSHFTAIACLIRRGVLSPVDRNALRLIRTVDMPLPCR